MRKSNRSGAAQRVRSQGILIEPLEERRFLSGDAVTTAAAAPTLSAATAPITVEHSLTHDVYDSVYASFESYDPATNVTTNVIVSATNSSPNGQPRAIVFLSVNQEINGDGPTLFAYGHVEALANASARSSTVSVNVDKYLNRATINATGIIHDFLTALPVTFTLSLNFDGVGDAVELDEHITDHSDPNIKVSYTSHDLQRDAVATGTLFVSRPVFPLSTGNIIPEPSLDAEMSTGMVNFVLVTSFGSFGSSFATDKTTTAAGSFLFSNAAVLS